MAREIAREEGLHFRLAVIHAEQDKEYLKRKLAEGRIRRLAPETPLDDAIIDRSEHIVGMMGTELFIFAGSLLLALAALGSVLKELHRRRSASRKRKREQR